jgi:hypothetical protein
MRNKKKLVKNIKGKGEKGEKQTKSRNRSELEKECWINVRKLSDPRGKETGVCVCV